MARFYWTEDIRVFCNATELHQTERDLSSAEDSPFFEQQ